MTVSATLETIVHADVPEFIAPIIYALPIQMLAYFTAVLMGTDVDQPRNLAKSVDGRIAARPPSQITISSKIVRPCMSLLGDAVEGPSSDEQGRYPRCHQRLVRAGRGSASASR